MKIQDLSTKARETLAKIAKSRGVSQGEILRHIVAISSGRKVSKHSVLIFGPSGV